MDPKPQDAKQLNVGDSVALFVGAFNPPTMDHYRAVEALFKEPEIKDIWICPLAGDDNANVRNMTALFCFEFSSTGKQISHCTAALDKDLKTAPQAIEWVRAKFPYLKFKSATVAPETSTDRDVVYFIKLGVAGDTVPIGSRMIALTDYAPVVPDLKVRIKGGSDEGRSIPFPIWNYIQKHKLYRN